MANEKYILIAEDEKSLQEALSEAFRSEDESIRIIEADDGEQALAAAFEHKPDLILLDLLMPNVNGHEVLRRIRASEGWGKDVKIVVLTQLDDSKTIASVLAEGGYKYIIKSNHTLKSIVESVMKYWNDEEE